MRDTVNSQYDSFLFWRLPIPELDLSELEHMGLAGGPGYQPMGGYGLLGMDRKKQNRCEGNEEEEESGMLQFNSFNFWRAPIAAVGPLDFDLL